MNRVRFDIQEPSDTQNGQISATHSEREDDFDDSILDGPPGSAQRTPLLTGIEAPSLTAALEINVEDLLERARPKSGVVSAFMNMANSIIGAGIIGREMAVERQQTWRLSTEKGL